MNSHSLSRSLKHSLFTEALALQAGEKTRHNFLTQLCPGQFWTDERLECSTLSSEGIHVLHGLGPIIKREICQITQKNIVKFIIKYLQIDSNYQPSLIAGQNNYKYIFSLEMLGNLSKKFGELLFSLLLSSYWLAPTVQYPKDNPYPEELTV